MSGGSLDYIYSKVQEAASRIRSDERSNTPTHKAFADHLEKVAKALHDIEWVQSCDYAQGDDIEAMRAVITPEMELRSAIKEAEKARTDLDASIAIASAMKERGK